MHLSLGEILVAFLFGALCLYFLGAIRVRELAVQAVGRAGRQDDFQLLDQAVHISRISLSRDRQGRWRIWRQYRFDYSFSSLFPFFLASIFSPTVYRPLLTLPFPSFPYSFASFHSLQQFIIFSPFFLMPFSSSTV